MIDKEDEKLDASFEPDEVLLARRHDASFNRIFSHPVFVEAKNHSKSMA